MFLLYIFEFHINSNVQTAKNCRRVWSHETVNRTFFLPMHLSSANLELKSHKQCANDGWSSYHMSPVASFYIKQLPLLNKKKYIDIFYRGPKLGSVKFKLNSNFSDNFMLVGSSNFI